MIDFRKTEFIGVAATLAQCPPPDWPEVVLSGRSNVGKSSLINILGDNRRLARTSMTPGKTRLVIYFMVDRKFLLTDLPGFGYAKVSHQAKEAFSELADRYLSSGRPVALVLHLLDIRHPPTSNDRLMLEWLQTCDLPYQIVLTKSDKLSRSQMLQRQREMAVELGCGDPEQLLVFSTENRQGVERLRQVIVQAVQAQDQEFNQN